MATPPPEPDDPHASDRDATDSGVPAKAIPPPASPKRRRRRRARWPWVVPLIAAGAILVFLKTDLVARIAATTLQTAVEAAIGEEVTIGGISVSYLPLEVGLEGVVIARRGGGERILGLKSIRATFGVRNWEAGLIRLAIESPDLRLHLDDDGLREFRDVVERPSKALPSRFPWQDLVVTDGHFLLTGDDLSVELSDVDIAPEPERHVDISWGALSITRGTIIENAGPTRFKHVYLGPDRVDAPVIDVRFDDLSIAGALSVIFDGPLGGELFVKAGLPAFTSNPADARKYVDGSVAIELALTGTLADPVIDADLETQNVVLWRINSKGEPSAVRFGDAMGPVHYEGSVASIGPVELPWGQGVVTVNGTLDRATSAVVLDLVGKGVHLGPLLQTTGAHHAPWVDFEADLGINVTGTASPLQLDGAFSIDLTDLLVRRGPWDSRNERLLDVPRGHLGGSLQLDAHHVIIDATDTRFGPSRGRVWGDIGFLHTGPLLVRADFAVLDLSWLQPLGGAGLGGLVELSGTLQGPFQHLSAEANVRGRDIVVLDRQMADVLSTHLESPDLKRLEFTDMRGTVGQSGYLGNYTLAFTPEGLWMDTQLVLPDAHIRDLTGIFLDLPGVDGHLSGDAVLHGPPRRLTGEVHANFDNLGVYGESFETGVGTAWMDDGILTLSDLTLHRAGEAVLARGSIGHQYAMNVEILTDGARIERLDALRGRELPVTGDLVADVRLGGTLFDWEPDGRIVADAVRVRGRAVDDSVVRFATGHDGVLAWTGELLGGAANLEGHIQIHGEQPYDLHAELTEFPAHILYPDGADGSPVTATLTGEVDLAGHFGDDPTPVDIEGDFPTVRLSWGGHTLQNEDDWIFAVHGRSVQVPGLSLSDGKDTKIGFEGWTTADGRAAFRGGGQIDLDLLRMFAPGLPLAEGVGTVDVRIGGSEGGAPVEVRFDTRGATIRTDWFPKPFSNLELTAVATADGYRFEGVKAEVGGGKFTGGGSIEAEAWRPRRYDLWGRLGNTRLQYLDYLPPIEGDANLRFDGPVDDLLLSGTIEIDSMDFRERIDWESKVVALQSSRLTDSASADRTDFFSMDLAVSADRTVHLRNNLADGDASADLRITGDTARPGMTGSIDIEPGGRFYLQDREFEIARGEIRYLDPYSFDPDVDIQLETDVRGREQDWHVYYGVAGPFSNWQTTTSADPYLSQADINTLLLFGMTRDEFEAYGGIPAAALAAQATDLVAAQFAANPTQLLDRWSLASGITARGTPTLDGDWRIVGEKDLLGFTVTGEIDLGDGDWYTSLERRVAKSFFATLYGTSQEEGRALSVATAWGTELKYRWELD